MFGYAIGQAFHFDEAVISIIWSFLSGTIIFNVLKRELPDENNTCFGSFITGSVLFSTLLFSM